MSVLLLCVIDRHHRKVISVFGLLLDQKGGSRRARDDDDDVIMGKNNGLWGFPSPLGLRQMAYLRFHQKRQ